MGFGMNGEFAIRNDGLVAFVTSKYSFPMNFVEVMSLFGLARKLKKACLTTLVNTLFIPIKLPIFIGVVNDKASCAVRIFIFVLVSSIPTTNFVPAVDANKDTSFVDFFDVLDQ